MEKKYIVTTTIHAPTEAIAGLAKMAGWERIVIGDQKTPVPWGAPATRFLDPSAQEVLDHALVPVLPWNLPARAMLGFLEAIAEGAEVITQVDDDNIPYENFAVPESDGEYRQVQNERFTNIYRQFTNQTIWPRGYPLDKILSSNKSETVIVPAKVGAWQHLADNDTDVDAIYRLTRNETITFEQNAPVTLAAGTACPFNCQSTTFYREFFALLYLPVMVHPRVSDIMRGYIAQPILWKYGHVLGFTAPIVQQDRNPHNYLKDFEAEVAIYLHAERILDIVEQSITPAGDVVQDLRNAYAALIAASIVPEEELSVLDAWCKDIERLMIPTT